MMMMPISQMQAMSAISSTSARALAPVQTDSLSHLDKVLQGILTAKKQQLINSTLLTGHGSHSGHEAQVSETGTYSSMATTSSSVQTPVNAFTSIPTSTFVTTMQPQEVKSMDNSILRSKQVWVLSFARGSHLSVFVRVTHVDIDIHKWFMNLYMKTPVSAVIQLV